MKNPRSRPPGNLRGPLRLTLAAGFFLGIGLLAGPLRAAETARLKAVPPADGPRRLRVAGRFDHPRFAVDDYRELTVALAGGAALPLEIESSSLIREFGQIVSARLSFTVDREALAGAGGELTLSWGAGVRGENTLVERLAAAPAAAVEFTWERGDPDAANEGDASFATLEVIAESDADYYFLWYLVPMGLVLVLLTIRKFAAA